MKQNIYYILCLILVLTIIYGGWHIKSINTTNAAREESFLSDIHQLDYELSTLLEFTDYTNENIGLDLQHDTIIVYDLDGIGIPLNNLINNTKLILRYSDFHCLACYEQHLLNFKEYIGIIGEENVLFIANYSSMRELYVFLRLNSLKCPVYNYKYSLLGDIDDNPYFLLANSDGEIINLSIIHKNFVDITTNFLHSTKVNFFSN